MATITDHFGISGPVPFVDAELDRDNEIFVDPHRIRISSAQPTFAASARESLDSFLLVIRAAVLSTNPARRAAGERLLTMFSEPRETRFGFARNSSNGHGGAEDIGIRLWAALHDVEALLRVAALKHLEELPLFVKGIDRDLTSDITTRIVFGALADFTGEMMRQFPELATAKEPPITVSRQLWEPARCDWVTRDVQLPAADGKPILLVPSDWVGRYLLMSSGRYHGTTVLTFVQGERAIITSGGKVSYPRKRDLRQHPNLRPGRQTNVEVTLRALQIGIDLLVEFRAFVAAKRENGGPMAA